MSVPRIRGFRIDESFGRIPIDVGVEQPQDGVSVFTASAPGAELVELVLDCAIDEHFAGFGEQFIQLDKRGRVIDGQVGITTNGVVGLVKGLDGGYKLWPVWYSSAGYAAIIDSSLRWRVELAVRDPHEVVVRLPSDSIRLTICDGQPADAVRLVTELTGRPPLAPPWAYGVWKAMRGGHGVVLAEARRMRDEGLGASAIWLDSHYEPDSNSGIWGSGTYPTGEYPDISQTVKELNALGLRAMTYVNPFLYKNTPAFEEAVANGYAVSDDNGEPILMDGLHAVEGDDMGILDATGLHSMDRGVAIVDFTNPDARTWWQGLLRKILLEEGFDGWMEDFGESVPAGAKMHDGTTHVESHNRYPILYHSAAGEEIARSKSDAVNFCRGGYLGAQAHGRAFWPGDQTVDWSAECGIGCLVPSGISIGLMGVAAWGTDIAGCMDGHYVAPFGGGSSDEELWIRWCQLGAMSPLMREHLGFLVEPVADVWSSPATTDMWRRCAEWHIALHPYLWTAAHEASATGMPIFRGLMLHWPEHHESWTLTTQYMLGPSLLCAPVLAKGERERRVWLPPGEWHDWWTGEVKRGPGWTTVPAPLDRWPVLQRGGSVVPLLKDVPLDLNDPKYTSGDFDVVARVAGTPVEPFVMFDGRKISE